MDFELQKCEYSIPLTNAQWTALNVQTVRRGLRGEYTESLYCTADGYEHPEIAKLKKAGCYDLNWNGHFGQNFLFKCYSSDSKRAKMAVDTFFRKIVKAHKKEKLGVAR